MSTLLLLVMLLYIVSPVGACQALSTTSSGLR